MCDFYEKFKNKKKWQRGKKQKKKKKRESLHLAQLQLNCYTQIVMVQNVSPWTGWDPEGAEVI